MGLFKKFDKLVAGAQSAVRDVQDSAESAMGKGMRAATGQGDAPLASNAEGIDIFAPLRAAANGIGYTYVARSESIDGVGWTLHANRDGLSFDDRDLDRGGARVTVEALNKPIASQLEWEAARRILGGDEDTRFVAGEQLTFLTHRIDHGWQSSFLRRRVAVRVQFEGPSATEQLAKDFAERVCFQWTDWAVADGWVRGLGVDPTRPLGSEPVAGVHVTPDAVPAEPARLDLQIPMADAVCAAVVADDAPRTIHDWDGFQADPEVLGFAPTSKAFVALDGWEGVVFRGAGGEFGQVIAIDAPEAVAAPDRFAALLLEGEPRPAEFDGNTIAVGLDVLGYPTAHVVVGELPFVVRLSGPAGHQGGKDLVHRFAVAALYAMPE